MTDSKRRNDPRDLAGRANFAQRGQAYEERLRDDDSARHFPGRARTREDVRDDIDPREGYYGSGGSYGYGGGFEHGGEPGYEEAPRGRYGRGGEEFYESTGGFGHEISYGREGLGYPGPAEDRYGSRGSQGFRREPRRSDDARGGYTQDSGFAQSGGTRKQATAFDGHPEPARRERNPAGARPDQRFYGSVPSGQQRGRIYGLTPQGYTRSDERIREDLCDRLSQGHIDPSEISVTVENGVVTLTGFTQDRSEKFHVEEIADAVLGVRDVDNRIRIRKPERQFAPQASEPGTSDESADARNASSGTRAEHGRQRRN